LPALAPLAAEAGLRLAAVTRVPVLLPAGVEPLHLPARTQEARMAWSLPRLLRRVRPALAHFVHSLPLACPCPSVLTVQDLSFEREPGLMRPWDRFVFRAVVRPSARRAARILAISERTRRDLVELYRIAPEKIAVTPLAADPAFAPGGDADGYLLFVGLVEPRKDPLAALEAAREVGRPLVVAGPEKDRRLTRELVRRGADVRGYVDRTELAELYRRAACVVLPTRYEGFGLPALEAMASGTPVVTTSDPAVREVAGDAAVYADREHLAEGIRIALADRERLAAAGLERARAFTWEETARRTLQVYLDVLRR
jgi:glycosyltransferase involved in cell wall biosynthesis